MTSRELRDIIEKVRNTDDWGLFQLRMKEYVGGTPQLLVLWFTYLTAKNTTFFSSAVHQFLFDFTTYGELEKRHGITEGALKNKVHRESTRFAECVGEGMMERLVEGSVSDAEAMVWSDHVKDIYEKLSKRDKRLEDYFYEDFISGFSLSHDFTGITDQEFINIRDRLARVSKSAHQFLMSHTDKRLVDYVAYLLTAENHRLSDEDVERKKNLILVMRLEDYFEGTDEND